MIIFTFMLYFIMAISSVFIVLEALTKKKLIPLSIFVIFVTILNIFRCYNLWITQEWTIVLIVAYLCLLFYLRR
jgi:hypothetical protein